MTWNTTRRVPDDEGASLPALALRLGERHGALIPVGWRTRFCEADGNTCRHDSLTHADRITYVFHATQFLD
jgi:hypothetical protein